MGSSRVRIQEGDITELETDAIVNPANTRLLLGTGVAGAIRAKGGPSIQAECDRHGPVELGEVAVTGAGELRARCIIHAAGMELGGSVSEATLRRVTQRCLEEAERRGLRSLALPAIGAGLGGLGLQRCAELMLEVVEQHLAAGSTLEEVRFVLHGEPAYRVFENVRDGQAARRQLERLRGLREKMT
jgi:O-acetyl-ADP-ribose deacetylase (regulator of RNase III)